MASSDNSSSSNNTTQDPSSFVQRDPGWAHCKRVEGKRNFAICRYCKKQMGGGITRLKHHLARTNDSKRYGQPCTKVPQKVTQEMKQLLNTQARRAKQRKRVIKEGSDSETSQREGDDSSSSDDDTRLDNSAPVKSRDPGWSHCVPVKGNRRGTICRYCKKQLNGGGISRLKNHLAGTHKDCTACREVPEEVKKQMRQILLENKKTGTGVEETQERSERKAEREKGIVDEGPSSSKGNKRKEVCYISSSSEKDEGSDEDLCSKKYLEKVAKNKGPIEKMVDSEKNVEEKMEQVRKEGKEKFENLSARTNKKLRIHEPLEELEKDNSSSSDDNTRLDSPSPVKSRDPGWAHCVPVKGNRYGTICRYCKKQFNGGGICRLKNHLAGTRKHSTACREVPEEVKKQMRQILLENKKTGTEVPEDVNEEMVRRVEEAQERSERKVEREKGIVDEGPSSSKGNKGKEVCYISSSSEKDEGSDEDLCSEEYLEKVVKKKGPIEKMVDSEKNVEKKSVEFEPTTQTTVRRIVSPPQQRSTRNNNCNRLKNEKQLDTNLVNSFLEDLWGKIGEEMRNSCTFFDPYWFFAYKYKKSRNVPQWTKEKKVFANEYVFVPILCMNHWTLLILCNFGNNEPCMILLDSLLATDPRLQLEKDIRSFVYDIYQVEGREKNKEFILNIPLVIPKVPQQINGDECGAYLLYFLYRFIQTAPKTFSLNECTYFLKKDWFTKEEIRTFKIEIETFKTKKRLEEELETREELSSESSDEVICLTK